MKAVIFDWDGVVIDSSAQHERSWEILAPDIFLLAAQKLHMPPADCLVIEDAHVGLEAARRAGMATLAVATTNPLADLQYADAAVESLASVTLDFLLNIKNSQA